MKNIFVLAILFLLVACSGGGSYHAVELIAHGGGEINDKTYTNSREALEKSVADGYRYIEIDFSFTADSVLVAAHDWRMFNRITGYEHKGDTAPTLAEFTQRRIHGEYTPLTAAELNDYFESNESLYLVTDKVSTPAVLAAYFPRLKERMVVEAFTYPHYEELCAAGYYRVLYSVLAVDDFYDNVKKHLLQHWFYPGRKIEWIATHYTAVNYRIYKILDNLCDFNIAAYTVNDWALIPESKLNRVKMIYTEKIKPVR